ncbi:putative F-box protein-like [Capsicum annuum]|nr:putative F-box protein-like [Capsicum annuum]KAF3656559.1 putative F-box protein-like [Capsicum annuum]
MMMEGFWSCPLEETWSRQVEARFVRSNLSFIVDMSPLIEDMSSRIEAIVVSILFIPRLIVSSLPKIAPRALLSIVAKNLVGFLDSRIYVANAPPPFPTQYMPSSLQDMLRPDFYWNHVFESFPYPRKYGKFVKIFLSASDKDELGDWVGCVKSRFRCLTIKLEEFLGFCDPNPTEYVDVDASEPNAVFYWRLPPARTDVIDISHMEEEFLKNTNNVHQGPTGKIKLSIVQADQLPQKSHFDSNRQSAKPCWRIVRSNQRIVPAYYNYQPIYVDGYLTTNASLQYPSAGVDGIAPPLTRGRGFDPGYGENSVDSAATLIGLATHDSD